MISLALVLLLSAAACGASFEYDEDAAIARAKEVIELANAGDYEAITSMFNDELAAALTLEQLKAALDPILAAAGDLVQYKTIKTSGVVQNNMNHIVVVAVCQYENSTQIYTISLTTDLMMSGFYIK